MMCLEDVRRRKERETVDFRDTDSIKPMPAGRKAIIAEAKRLLHNEV
jgi:hypothetical protein